MQAVSATAAEEVSKPSRRPRVEVEKLRSCRVEDTHDARRAERLRMINLNGSKLECGGADARPADSREYNKRYKRETDGGEGREARAGRNEAAEPTFSLVRGEA